MGYRACSAGIKEQEATNLLEKAYKKSDEAKTPLPSDEAVRLAITTFQVRPPCMLGAPARLSRSPPLLPTPLPQSLLSADFKAEEIEVGLAGTGARFRVLSTAEVEAHLTAVAERD